MDDQEPDLQDQVEELASTVEQLQSELDRRPRRRPLLPPPPSTAELRQFTSEVAIPGLVLLLETNVRALKLLQRTLRLADDGAGGSGERAVASQAADVGTTALAHLEDALAQAQDALEGQPPNDEARELLSQARDLRADIESRLDDRSGRTRNEGDTIPVEEDDAPAEPSGPEVDVEAELQSIKDQVDDGDDADGADADEDGDET